MGWFEVDRKGLAQLLAEHGPARGIVELVSNAWDEDGVTEVSVWVQRPPTGSRTARVTVTDDSPNGFRDLREAFTLFSPSYKKGDVKKRGRFNLGEKLMLAMCTEATIISTKGGVRFDSKGRTMTTRKREKGTQFIGQVKMSITELNEVIDYLEGIISPEEITTTINDVLIASNAPVVLVCGVLPTVIEDEEGNLRPSRRHCEVHISRERGISGMLYEMGIPIVEIGGPFSVNVMQKIPLNMEKDNVTPAYLRAIRGMVLNGAAWVLTEEESKERWVTNGLEDPCITPMAIKKVLDLRFGEKRVTFDASDPEATKRATSEGYTVVHGGSLPAAAWENVKAADAISPAGVVTPTKHPEFSAEGRDISVPRSKWTPEQLATVEAITELSELLIEECVAVDIVRDITFPFAAWYGGNKMTLNLGKLGRSFFENGTFLGQRQLALVIHELGHHYEADHLSPKYYDALCTLGAKLALLVNGGEVQL